MYQQIFLPVSKGLMTSAPSSLIPDGAASDCNNVRFDDGYVEKVKGFVEYKTIANTPILAINQYKPDAGLPKNIVHTEDGVYWVRDEISDYSQSNLIDLENETYELSEYGHISSHCAFGEYYFCGLGIDVHYWNGSDTYAKKLEGLFDAPCWEANHEYSKGDIVKPTESNYTGYIYECQDSGMSGSEEPAWESNMKEPVSDSGCYWIGCGSDEVAGNSAKSVQAQCIGDYKGFLFVANTTEDSTNYPTRLRWSQYQNPRLWHNNEDDSGMAGYVDVDDTVGKIMDIKKIGDILAIYKEDGIVSISYTGGDVTFSKELITTKAGLVSPQAIVVLPHSHIFVGKDNIYEFDGNSVTPIGDDIRKYFFKRLTSVTKIIGYYEEESKDVIFAYDDSYNNSSTLHKAIVYNTFTKTWSSRDLDVTALGDFIDTQDAMIEEIQDAIDSENMQNRIIDSSLYKVQNSVIVAGTSEGKIYKLKGYRNYSGDYDGYFVSKTHHMDDPLHIKRLLRIQFHVEAQDNCDMYVQVKPLWDAETVENEETWENIPKHIFKFRRSDAQNPVAPPYVDIDLSARYFKIKFGTSKNNEYFKVLGYSLLYQTRGDV